MGLYRLAWKIFRLTRYQEWTGGKCSAGYYAEPKKKWAKMCEDKGFDLEAPSLSDKVDNYWMVSPEVEVRGIRFRVAVVDYFLNTEDPWHHRVYVFADDKLKYPGGSAKRYNFPWRWSTKIAKIARGDSGPVYGRHRILEEAADRLKDEKKLLPDPDRKLLEEALEEVERDLQSS